MIFGIQGICRIRYVWYIFFKNSVWKVGWETYPATIEEY